MKQLVLALLLVGCGGQRPRPPEPAPALPAAARDAGQPSPVKDCPAQLGELARAVLASPEPPSRVVWLTVGTTAGIATGVFIAIAAGWAKAQ